MEAIYLNNFRIDLPVAFPATRRPTYLISSCKSELRRTRTAVNST